MFYFGTVITEWPLRKKRNIFVKIKNLHLIKLYWELRWSLIQQFFFTFQRLSLMSDSLFEIEI